MRLSVIACGETPVVLLALAVLIAAALAFFWAREAPPPAVRIDDRSTWRHARDPDGIVGHIVGLFAVGFAIAAALNHPVCQ